MTQTPEIREQVARVRQAFAGDADLGPFVNDLRIEAGDPWRISGEVESVAARRKAVRVARRTLPGADVEDGVRLSPTLRRSDDGLAEALAQALREEPAFAAIPVLETGQAPPRHDAPWIAVLVHDGTVYLGGYLDLAGKSLAESIAWETGSCCDVRNLIHHAPGRDDPDHELASAVKTLIDQHTSLDPATIAVTVDHGVVELAGDVAAPRQREAAVRLCWLVPGVAAVRDRMGPAPQ